MDNNTTENDENSLSKTQNINNAQYNIPPDKRECHPLDFKHV